MRDCFIWILGTAWLAAVALGFGAWERHIRTPGADIVQTIPDQEATDRWRLLLFVHPHCPCVRSSLEELTETRQALPELELRIVFVRPEGSEPGWEQGESWDAARSLPRSEVVVDSDGAEARRVGAKTSGQAVLIDPSGRAVFRGGLTRGRGVTGESLGRQALLGWIRDGHGAESAPVYGCPLETPNE